MGLEECGDPSAEGGQVLRRFRCYRLWNAWCSRRSGCADLAAAVVVKRGRPAWGSWNRTPDQPGNWL